MANERIRPNDRHAIAKSRRSRHVGPLCPDEYGVFPRRQTHTLNVFQSQRNLRKVLKKIAKLTIDSPAAMAKPAIDRASIVFGKKKSGDSHSKSGDREIFIILSKIGRSPEKSGDLEALRRARSCTKLEHNGPLRPIPVQWLLFLTLVHWLPAEETLLTLF